MNRHNICNICGEDFGQCPHILGAVYNGVVCERPSPPSITDWRTATCGECAWAVIVKLPHDTEATICRRTTFGGTGTSADFGEVCNSWPACPAFVANEASQ